MAEPHYQQAAGPSSRDLARAHQRPYLAPRAAARRRPGGPGRRARRGPPACPGCSPPAATQPPGGGSRLDAAGSPAWWRRQKLHYTLNFANWPDYIDVLDSKHPTLEHFTDLTGITVNYSEPVSENLPFYARSSHRLSAGSTPATTSSSPRTTPGARRTDEQWLAGPAGPVDDDQLPGVRRLAVLNPPWDPGNTYTMAWQSGWTAIGYNSRLVTDPATASGSCSTRSTRARSA